MNTEERAKLKEVLEVVRQGIEELLGDDEEEKRELRELNIECEIEANKTQNILKRFGFYPYKRYWRRQSQY